MRWGSASAPGKAVVSGEYAVLDGAPAISMALDRRARVTLRAADGDCHSVCSAGSEPLRFGGGRAGALEWAGGGTPPDYALFEQVWRHAKPSFPGRVALTLDTTDFRAAGSGEKLGLGSSAALAVALAVALHGGDRARAADTAAAAHRAFQGGRGSGLDVVTAAHGGLIGFRLDSPVETLEWPATLRYFLLWSGKPASTAEKLRQLEDSAGSTSSRRSAAALVKASQAVFDAWRAGSEAGILAAFEAYVDALRRFSDDRDLGVFGAGHEELAGIAAEYGLVYKPCGAGGGDIGIVLIPQAADTAEFSARAEGLGFTRLDCALDPGGVRVEDGSAA